MFCLDFTTLLRYFNRDSLFRIPFLAKFFVIFTMDSAYCSVFYLYWEEFLGILSKKLYLSQAS